MVALAVVAVAVAVVVVDFAVVGAHAETAAVAVGAETAAVETAEGVVVVVASGETVAVGQGEQIPGDVEEEKDAVRMVDGAEEGMGVVLAAAAGVGMDGAGVAMGEGLVEMEAGIRAVPQMAVVAGAGATRGAAGIRAHV